MLRRQLFHGLYRKFRRGVLFLFFTFLFLLLFFFIKTLTTISSIEISGSENLRGVNPLKGKMIFFISPKKIEQQLYDANPQLKSVRVMKKYPNSIKIVVDEEKIAATIKVADGYFYLSSSGRIMAKKRMLESDITRINYYQKLNFDEYAVGEVLKHIDIQLALFFIRKFSYLGLKTDSLDINSFDMLVLKIENKRYFFTINKDKEIQYQQFKKIFERFRIERTEYESIDLRFDKPIIKLKSS